MLSSYILISLPCPLKEIKEEVFLAVILRRLLQVHLVRWLPANNTRISNVLLHARVWKIILISGAGERTYLQYLRGLVLENKSLGRNLIKGKNHHKLHTSICIFNLTFPDVLQSRTPHKESISLRSSSAILSQTDLPMRCHFYSLNERHFSNFI